MQDRSAPVSYPPAGSASAGKSGPRSEHLLPCARSGMFSLVSLLYYLSLDTMLLSFLSTVLPPIPRLLTSRPTGTWGLRTGAISSYGSGTTYVARRAYFHGSRSVTGGAG